jgi:hypothetical protein
MGTKSSVPRRAGKSDKLALDDASSTRRRHKKSSPQRSRQRSQSEISADIKDAVAFAKAANEFSERDPGGVPLATLTPDVRDRVCRCREWVLQDLRAKGQLPPDRIEPVVDDLVGAAWYLHTLQPTRPQEIQEASAGVAVGVTEFQFEPTALVDLNDKRVPTRRPRSPPAGAAGRFPAPARGSPVRCGAGYQPATGAGSHAPAGTPKDRVQLPWRPNRDEISELAEFGWTNLSGKGRGLFHRDRFSARPSRISRR